MADVLGWRRRLGRRGSPRPACVRALWRRQTVGAREFSGDALVFADRTRPPRPKGDTRRAGALRRRPVLPACSRQSAGAGTPQPANGDSPAGFTAAGWHDSFMNKKRDRGRGRPVLPKRQVCGFLRPPVLPKRQVCGFLRPPVLPKRQAGSGGRRRFARKPRGPEKRHPEHAKAKNAEEAK